MAYAAFVPAVCLLSLPLCAQNSTPEAAPSSPPPQAASETVPKLSAGEAFRYAMQPFVDARSAPNDLTEADQWALGLGVSRAKQECQALTSTKQEGEDLLAFGRLCAFGQVLEPARRALIDYLALPKMEDEKGAHLALARVFEGLGWPSSAESQVDSLTSLFPYDADIHWATDQVIEAAEAPKEDGGTANDGSPKQSGATGLLGPKLDPELDPGVVQRLNELQLPFLLKALAAAESLKGKDSTVDTAVLARDALRCAAAMREAGKKKEAADLVEQIRALTAVPAIAQTASRPAIDSAFARYELIGQQAPFEALHGTLLAKAPVPAVRRLAEKTTVIVAFSLSAPQSQDILQKLDTALKHAQEKKPVQLIAVTSYAAMNGEDEKTDAVLSTLEAFRSTLPTDLPVMIVPDRELKAFAIDTFPAAVVIDATGRIVCLNLLSGSAGSIHMVLRAALE